MKRYPVISSEAHACPGGSEATFALHDDVYAGMFLPPMQFHALQNGAIYFPDFIIPS
jgi:hypothetical protein